MNPAPILTLIALLIVLRVVVRYFWGVNEFCSEGCRRYGSRSESWLQTASKRNASKGDKGNLKPHCNPFISPKPREAM